MVDSVNLRYGSLNFFNEQTTDLQNDRAEINKLLSDESYYIEDKNLIGKFDEVENILNDKLEKYGGYQKDSVSE